MNRKTINVGISNYRLEKYLMNKGVKIISDAYDFADWTFTKVSEISALERELELTFDDVDRFVKEFNRMEEIKERLYKNNGLYYDVKKEYYYSIFGLAENYNLELSDIIVECGDIK